MDLTPRQQETIEHLKQLGITTPDEIIAYCKTKITLPRYHGRRQASLGGKRHHKKDRRTHTKEYFQQIIDYLMQKGGNL